MEEVNADSANYQNCRFYEQKYPEVDEFVMVNVKQVRIGAALALLHALTCCSLVHRLRKWAPTSSCSSMTTSTA